MGLVAVEVAPVRVGSQVAAHVVEKRPAGIDLIDHRLDSPRIGEEDPAQRLKDLRIYQAGRAHRLDARRRVALEDCDEPGYASLNRLFKDDVSLV